MSRNTRVAVGASVAIAVVVGWLGYASFFHFVLGAAAAGLLALPTGVCLLAWLMWRFLPLRSRGEFDASLAAIGRYSAVLALGLILSWPVGLLVGAPLRANAKTWMLAQTAALASYFEAHGKYPAALEEVADLSSAPRLVRNGFTVYMRWDTHYGFFMGDSMFDDEWAWFSPPRSEHECALTRPLPQAEETGSAPLVRAAPTRTRVASCARSRTPHFRRPLMAPARGIPSANLGSRR